MTFRPARRSGSEIILTPLIDIMFTVLLFLVLSATFTEQTVVRIVSSAGGHQHCHFDRHSPGADSRGCGRPRVSGWSRGDTG